MAHLEREYGYKIEDYGIEMDLASLFKVLYSVGYGSTQSAHFLAKMLIPLFRDIPGGVALCRIIIALEKGSLPFDQIENIMRMITLTRFAKHAANAKPAALKFQKENFEKLEGLIKPVSSWVSGMLMLMAKLNTFDESDYREKFSKMMTDFKEFRESYPDQVAEISDLEKQIEFMVMIAGLCSGKFEFIEHLGVMIGCFDNQKVRELFGVLNKYKDIIFRGGVSGLPNIVKDMKFSALADVASGAISDAKDSAMQGAKEGLDKAKGLATGKMNEAASMMKDKMSGFSADVQSVTSDMGLFTGLFEQFDQDKSGFIDYGEF